MDIFEEARSALEREYKKRQSRNPKYSLRAYAKCLGISAARLSDVLNGRRKLSVKQFEKVNVELGGSLSIHLTGVRQYENKVVFSEDEFELIANWIYLAVLSYLNSKREDYASSYLAKIFDFSLAEMDGILSRLERLKLVKKIETLDGGAWGGTWKWVPGPEKTTDQIPSEAIKNFHKQMLDETRSRIDSVPLDLRDFSSSVIMIDPKKISEAKEEIRNFRRKLATFLEDGEPSQVFALNVQLLPLSRSHAEVIGK